MTNLDSILKSRDITLPTKVRLVKAMVFPVDMYGCESWTVKNLPAMQETWVQSLSQEDILEKGMPTHSSILAWEIPRTEEPGGLRITDLLSSVSSSRESLNPGDSWGP